MSEKIEYKLRLNIDHFGEFAIGVDSLLTPYLAALKLLVFGVVTSLIAIIYFASLYSTPEASSVAQTFGIAGIIIGLVIAVSAFVFAENKQHKLIAKAMWKRGTQYVRIDEYGIVLNSLHTNDIYQWSAVDNVREVESGICISLFGYSFVPLPDDCLPEGMTRSMALHAVNNWHKA